MLYQSFFFIKFLKNTKEKIKAPIIFSCICIYTWFICKRHMHAYMCVYIYVCTELFYIYIKGYYHSTTLLSLQWRYHKKKLFFSQLDVSMASHFVMLIGTVAPWYLLGGLVLGLSQIPKSPGAPVSYKMA